jgi:hypothetical protein
MPMTNEEGTNAIGEKQVACPWMPMEEGKIQIGGIRAL